MNIANTVQIRDWHTFLRDGEQFIKTARFAHMKRKKGFSQDALYNLTCMGIEKLIMALLMKKGDLAENHTMQDLAGALQKHIGSCPEIEEKLLFLGSFQEICDLDTYVTRQPDKDEIEKIVKIGDDLHYFLAPHLYS